MKTYDFIALDVETATSSKPRFICQLGLAYVKDNMIIKTESYLIQPPENHIEPILSKIHKITPKVTASQPSFLITWQKVKHNLLNNLIVAHNASFDQSVLSENLEYYNINDTLNPFVCTYRIFQQGLKDLCMGFDINYSNHHDACFDAKCCAQFYLNYLNGNYPKDSKPQTIKKSYRKKIITKILEQNLEADCSNPFYKKKIVVTGTFSVDRSQLSKDLAFLGAKIVSSISGATNIVVKGENPGPSKIKKVKKLLEEGKHIKVIEEQRLLDVLKKWV